MIFRLSQKLAKKIKVQPVVHADPSPNPYLDWTGHLFTAERSQYIILTNTFSLLSVIFHGRGVTDDNLFVLRALTLMKEYLSEDPFTFFFPRVIEPYTNRVFFSKSADRRVIGSMNDLISNARHHLVQDSLTPFRAAQRINGMPMSFLGMDTPERAFRRLRV
ncbi:MAG TPA: hypothetical protein PKM41_07380 [Deltaproteobacteria bacterium]|jgi:hypothetical protein|nr:hypothetical protein [Deltaproteobacteria bacterium]HOI06966.1 hypothetical protein [Deltaproteobacteria bacterium]